MNLNFRHFTIAGILYFCLFGLLLGFAYVLSTTNAKLESLVTQQKMNNQSLVLARSSCVNAMNKTLASR